MSRCSPRCVWTPVDRAPRRRRSTAAQAIVSFSHVGRCRSDAAFAALSETGPLQASSGKTVRHRLNRGGDRASNCAIHTIAKTRMGCCATSPASSTALSTPARRSPPRP
ncbi:transposase [Pseudonocardia sp.]|uniref:transposase n=1 Tax=Pseudonocardia sp. TaxID=60912 RepID=UPI00345DF468